MQIKLDRKEIKIIDITERRILRVYAGIYLTKKCHGNGKNVLSSSSDTEITHKDNKMHHIFTRIEIRGQI